MRDRRLVPYNLRLKSPARTLRRASTPAERKLWFELLRDFPEKFTRLRLVIEIDGDSHFAPGAGTRDARVLRFANLEVREQFEAVCLRIKETLAEEA